MDLTQSKGSVTPGPRPELYDGVGWSQRRDQLGGKRIRTKPECRWREREDFVAQRWAGANHSGACSLVLLNPDVLGISVNC